MGKPRWDSVYGADTQIHSSVITLKNLTEFYALYRELEIKPEDVHWLAGALTNVASFRQRVPEFLNNWTPPPGGNNSGLKWMAKIIHDSGPGGLPKQLDWRFGINPIPSDAPIDPSKKYHFEIRAIWIFASPAYAKRFSALKQTKGRASAEFFEAIDKLKGGKKIQSFLQEIYPLAKRGPAHRARRRGKKKK